MRNLFLPPCLAFVQPHSLQVLKANVLWILFVSDKSSATISRIHSKMIRQAGDKRQAHFSCEFPFHLRSPSLTWPRISARIPNTQNISYWGNFICEMGPLFRVHRELHVAGCRAVLKPRVFLAWTSHSAAPQRSGNPLSVPGTAKERTYFLGSPSWTQQPTWLQHDKHDMRKVSNRKESGQAERELFCGQNLQWQLSWKQSLICKGNDKWAGAYALWQLTGEQAHHQSLQESWLQFTNCLCWPS